MIAGIWKSFETLSTPEFYKIMKARQQVFIIEQSCIYADLDGADQQSWHLMGWELVGDKLRQCPIAISKMEPLPSQGSGSIDPFWTGSCSRPC